MARHPVGRIVLSTRRACVISPFRISAEGLFVVHYPIGTVVALTTSAAWKSD